MRFKIRERSPGVRVWVHSPFLCIVQIFVCACMARLTLFLLSPIGFFYYKLRTNTLKRSLSSIEHIFVVVQWKDWKFFICSQFQNKGSWLFARISKIIYNWPIVWYGQLCTMYIFVLHLGILWTLMFFWHSYIQSFAFTCNLNNFLENIHQPYHFSFTYYYLSKVYEW